MSRARTLTSLIDDVRKRSDVENVTARFPDAEITEYINQSIARLMTVLERADDTYYQTTYSFSTTNAIAVYALPADFWVLKGVDIVVSPGITFRARKYMPDEGPWLASQGVWAAGFPCWYRLQGSNIKFAPVPTGIYTINLTYSSAPTRLVNGSETFDGRAGFEEWVILDAAMKVRRKQHTDTSDLAMDKAEAEAWLTSNAPRDNQTPERIQDVQAMDYYRYPWIG